MRKNALALGCALFAATASADSISTDRPGQSNSPSVVAPGTVQLEGGFTFERETDGGDPNTNTISVPNSLLRVGVLSFLEARVFADGFIYEDRNGDNDRSSGSDLTIGGRVRVFDQEGIRPATALDFNLSLPTGSDAVTSDGVDPGGIIILEWALNDRFTILSNVGLASTSLGKGDSRRAFQVAPTLSVISSITERLGAFVEYYATYTDEGIDDEQAMDGGFTWLATDNLQLDLSAGAGLNHAAADFYVAAGASWRFSLR